MDKNESINIPKAHQLSACAATGCAVDADQLMVKCNECKLFTHSRCTKLPAYQLLVFKTCKPRYVCETCAGPVPEDFLKCINQMNVNSNLQGVIDSLQESLSLKTDESNSFLGQTRELKHQITELKQKIKDMEHQHASMTTKLKEYEVSPSILPRTPRKVSEKDFLKSIVTIIETKLVMVEEQLKQSITNELEKSKRTIDNKLYTIMKDNKSYAESVKGSASAKESVPRAKQSGRL